MREEVDRAHPDYLRILARPQPSSRFAEIFEGLPHRTAVDLRGYGGSDRPAEDDAYGIEHLVKDVVGLVEATSDSPVLLVAHDWGGVVAWVVAHRRPDLLRGLVVMNAPHPDVWERPEVDPVQAQASSAYVPLIAEQKIGPEVVEGFLSPFLAPESLEQLRTSWALPGAKAAMSAWYRANVEPVNHLPVGNTVEVPTVAIWGIKDSFVTPSELDHLPNLVTNLKVVRLDTAGHWLPNEAPDDVAGAILALDATLP